MGRGLGGERYTSLSPCLLIKMICGDPFSLHSSLLPQLPHSCYWGATVCELLVSVFSQGPQPATDSLTAVSGTFTLEVLWQTDCARQAFQWKCSTQPFATAFLIHYLLTLFSEWTLAFPPLDVTPNWVWQKLKFLRTRVSYSTFSLAAGVLAFCCRVSRRKRCNKAAWLYYDSFDAMIVNVSCG